MHRCFRESSTRWLLPLAVVFAAHHPLEAQFLDLDPLPPIPELADKSIVGSQAERLRSEIDILRDHDTTDAIISTIAATLRTHRRVAFLLLAQARAHPEAHHTAMAGLLLAHEREKIDRTIVLLGGDPPLTVNGNKIDAAQLAELLALLDRFCANATNLIDSVDVTKPDDLDAALAFALEPLLEVCLALEERTLVDPWLANDPVKVPPLERCRAAVERIEAEHRRALAQAALERLEPMLPFPDLRTRAELDAATLARALRLEQAITDARWLSGPRRESVLARLDATLEHWQDRATRSHARAELNHLAAVAELVEAANDLDRVDPESRAMRRSIDEIVAEEAELDRADRIVARIRRLSRATTAVRAATAVRELEMTPPARHLLGARRSLDRDYKRAEREVFDRLTELVGTSTALVDPDLAGLVARQRELADDLQLLRDTQAWSDFVQESLPARLKRFNSILQILAQQLAQSARRGEASLALDTMARQFDAALDPPFFDRLQAGDSDAIALTGGRDRELHATFEAARVQLVEDWIDGAPDGEGARRFDRLLRLLDQLETLSRVVAAGGMAHLERWGGWALAPRAGSIDPSALSARLKLATEALLRDDEEDFARQLDRLDEEIPLARLAMRIGASLGPPLRALPEGTAARLSRLAVAPTPEDALLVYREDLTELARFTWELEEARRVGESDRIRAIQAYCSALAQLIVEDLEARPQALPELDPLPGGVEEDSGRMN